MRGKFYLIVDGQVREPIDLANFKMPAIKQVQAVAKEACVYRGALFEATVKAFSVLGPVVTSSELEKAFQRASEVAAEASRIFQDPDSQLKRLASDEPPVSRPADRLTRRTKREIEADHARMLGRPAQRRG